MLARDCSFSPQSVLVLTPPKILSAGIPHCAALRGPQLRGAFAFCIQMTPSALPELFRDLLCQPRRADLLCTTSTPRVLPGGAFAHLILMTASANIFYNRGAIVLAIYLLDMKAPAYKCKTMPPNRNFDLDHDAGNTLDTKITEPRVQTRLCLAEKWELKSNFKGERVIFQLRKNGRRRQYKGRKENIRRKKCWLMT